MREGSGGLLSGSIVTSPVNHSAGPFCVGRDPARLSSIENSPRATWNMDGRGGSARTATALSSATHANAVRPSLTLKFMLSDQGRLRAAKIAREEVGQLGERDQ